MLKRVLACVLMLTVVFLTAACSSDSDPGNEVAMPSSSRDFEGQQFQGVVDALNGAGFTNVEPVALGDLVTGLLHDEGEVKNVDVDGDSLFTTDDSFPADVNIVVNYHSFPQDDEESPSASPTAEPASPTAEPSPTTITSANNAEFAALLTLTDYCSADIADFAVKYKGQSIEFDGAIVAMQNHGDYDTRYDILINAGDYSATVAQPGPNFKFEDVNTTYDLHLSGSNGKDTIGVGDNLHIIAEVDEFESTPCLFLIEPVATAFR